MRTSVTPARKLLVGTILVVSALLMLAALLIWNDAQRFVRSDRKHTSEIHAAQKEQAAITRKSDEIADAIATAQKDTAQAEEDLADAKASPAYKKYGRLTAQAAGIRKANTRRESTIRSINAQIRGVQRRIAARRKAERARLARMTRIEGDGTFMVGSDVLPGTYRSTGNTDMCYWARLRNLSGDFDSIISNNISNGTQVVQILSSDTAIEVNRCNTFRKIG